MSMSLSKSFVFTLTVLSYFFIHSINAQNVIYELDSAKATVYYDLTNSLCDNVFYANWAEVSGINKGVPFCQGQVAKSLDDLGTNRIVAMNAQMIKANPSEWCGKEVQIIDSSGSTLSFSEGPLFIWDACDACSSASIIDLSAEAFVQLSGGTCGNNPTGLTVKVLDTNVWDYGGGSGGGATTVTTATSTAAPQPTTSITTTSTTTATTHISFKGQGKQRLDPSSSSSKAIQTSLSSFGGYEYAASIVSSFATSRTTTTVLTTTSITTTSSPQPTGSSGNCTFGAWQCDGLSLEVCNYVTTTQLDWVTIETCQSKCQITDSGSVDCE